MRAGAVGHLQHIARQWRAAWAGRRDNPLPRYWAAAESRRCAKQAWYARQPGLLATALLLSAGATFGAINAAASVLRLGQGSAATRAYAMSSLSSATNTAILCVLLVCLLWLLGRVYLASQLALGFLERQPRQRLRLSLDDMLAVSRLSEQEIITGFVLHGLRLLSPPLLALSLLMLLGTIDFDAGSAASLQTAGALPLFTSMLSGLVIAAQFYIGGLLAAVALLLMLLPFGLTDRAGLMPFFGASAQVLLQLVQFGVGCYLVTVFVGMPDSAHNGDPGMPELLGFAIPAYLFMWLLFYLARRLDGLRTLLGYGFPLIVASAGLSLLGYTLLNGDADTGVFVMLSQAWALQGLALLSPQHIGLLAPILSTVDEAVAREAQWYLWAQWGLMLLFQCGYVVIFAEFARDAIKRRKWGTA